MWRNAPRRLIAHPARRATDRASSAGRPIPSGARLPRRTLAAPLGVFSFLTPLFGVVLGVWLLGETLDARFIAGSGFVLAGIGLVSGHAGLSRRFAALGAAATPVRAQLQTSNRTSP